MEQSKILNQVDISQSSDYYRSIPRSILNEDIKGTASRDFFTELNEIKSYYDVYLYGAEFSADNNGDYIPSEMKYRQIYDIINQEARFMFSRPVDVIVNRDANGSDKEKEHNTIIQNFISKVLYKNNFNHKLLRAAKDCFIGKRIAIVVNFDEETGIAVNVLNATEFYYEFSEERLVKFIAFFVDKESSNATDRRIRKKTYELNQNNICHIVETIYDGSGKVIETLFDNDTLLDFIPAWIVLNDGLVNDLHGESEVKNQMEYEGYYSKFANGDFDALRKSMNPIRYVIDGSQNSTANLSSGPGAFWDIQSDENGVEQKKASVGQLEANMNYSAALKDTLNRVQNQMYLTASVPNITSETIQGVITSGKTLQALYWPMAVRSDEKMIIWGTVISHVAEAIYYGSISYSSVVAMYISESLPITDIEVFVEANYAIPQDEAEEKETDLAEVNAQVMSRKSYMKKWRGLTDEECDEELKQIALEKELLESTSQIPMQGDYVQPNDLNNYEDDGEESEEQEDVAEDSSDYTS